uniref:HEAT repeat-containing protein 1 n=1 Tax=Varanus komodoensis TaxID=61221 RepID=A0A8D2JID2_VARKO
MTSLAHQLKRLALPQNDPSLLSRSEAASLLFDCKEAASIDRETFFAIGCTGLEELIGIDPSFQKFESALFSQLSKGLERSVQTKAVNQQLDESISLFLIHLSPYFMLKPAQKCLEWLIHRFHIHLYNQDSLIGCVLPYHETKLFVRVIQLLKINDPTHKWHWLHPIQKPGVPLARGTLITHCHKDLGFMDFICSLVTKSVKAFSLYPESLSQMRVLFTFYASTIVSALGAAENITDTLVSRLLPYIQKGLKSSLVDYRAATYMIISQLAVKMTMEKSLLHSLMLQISKTLAKTPSLIKEGLSCLIILLQNQKGDGLGKKPFTRLCMIPNLISMLCEISTTHDVSPVLRYMLPYLVQSVIYGKTGMLSSSMAYYISYNTILFIAFFANGRYPRTLDLVLEEYLKDVRNQKEQDKFHQFISLSMSGGKYQFLEDSDTSLLLSLNHPQPAVRVLAVQHLKGIIEASEEGFDDSFIEEAISARLKDDNLEVVMSALGALEVCLHLLNGQKEILRENRDLLNQLVLQLLPLIIITSNDSTSTEWEVALCIAESGLCSLHPLLKGWPEDEVWWNPETLSEKSKDYLQLLLQLFDILVHGASEGFYDCTFFNFKVHLKEPEDQFKFLSVLWTYNYNITNQLDFVMDAILQTRALYIGCAMLTSQAVQKKRQLASADSPVIISLLINLASPVSEVRRAALNCLHSLSNIKESAFHPILHNLVQKAEEITSDQTYIIQVTLWWWGGGRYSGASSSPFFFVSVIPCTGRAPCKSLGGRLLVESFCQGPSFSSEVMLKDEALLLHLILGKFNEHSAPLICTDQQCLELFIKALHTSKEVYKGLSTFQIRALGQITKPFFAAVADGKVQQKILGVLFDLLLNCKNPNCAQAINNVFKGISVDAEQVRMELEPLPKAKNLATVHQTRRQKMQQQRKAQNQECTPEESSVNWQRVTLILELLQHKKKLKQPQALIPTLFSLLARCLEPSAEKENLEYIKQLILGCLLNICQKLSPDGVLDEEKFNVELIVQCIRVSEMPQTHHHALLLLGAAAGMFPGKVLHNIMPIFTFMGANVMRLDNAYSFQVINKTVKMVIPALIQAEDNGSSETSGNLEEVVIKIIRVFVDALPHVPEHRCLPILEQLISTLGGERFLWILLVLLFEQHVTKSVTAVANGEKDTILESDTEFWISVCCEFSAIQQLQSLRKVLDYLTKLPENKEDDPGKKKSRVRKIKSQSEETELFNVDSHSGKQLRHFKFLSVSFMSQLLASHSFVKKVVECEDAEELKESEQRLLEDVLCFINVVAISVEKHTDTPTAKFWRALLNKSYDMLDKVNALMPTETFIPVIRGLMANQLPSVRRKAMDLLNNKLQQRTQWQQTQVELLLEMVPDLIAVVQHNIRATEEEQAVNRQTALFSLKLLCKCFGTEKPELFVTVLKTAIDVISVKGKEEKNVAGSALLCAAEVTCVVKALAIPQLPRLMPALINILKHKKELIASEIYLLSTVTSLLKIVETLPHFLSPYLLDILLQVVHLDRIAVEMGPSSHIKLRVTSLKSTLATKLPPRVLLPAVAKCYRKIAKTFKNHLGAVMDILKEHIITLGKDQLTAHQSELTAFFMKALDFRAEHSQDDLEEVGKIETHIIMCLISMVMKLSEMSFRPLFFKLFDWAKTEGTSKDRQLTFCRLADCIAEQLKGLFTLFAGHLVKPFADTLNQVNTSQTDDAFFDYENTEKSCLLLQSILDCLHKIFLFDSHHFVSKERAETLMMPLVNQLENIVGGEERFQERVTMHLIPCIAQFAVAMADDSLWKPLNYQILLKMRHASPKVRFAALLALLELAEKIRENYMVLLPESIPFLAELMEDECEEVEHQCQKTIQQLEVILGESLQSYF